jgi:hypothetical protein
MPQHHPPDDTAEYTERTLSYHRLTRDYLGSDVRGTLGVILFAALVVGLGVLLMYLVF